mgnify:CR=1 FL=1
MKRYRVIHWGTGRVGMPTLRGILERPDFELVGLYVSSSAKEGRDAGELCGAARSGIRATRDRAALIALAADCVCYTATDVGRIPEVIDDLCALLASGKNVVNTAITLLVHPREYDPAIVQRLRSACEKGRSTLYTTGIHPGVFSDAMLYAVTSMSQQIESITALEMLDCSMYDATVLSALGFGWTPEEDARRFDPQILHYYWSPIVKFMADAYGLKLDEIRHFREHALSKSTFDTSGGLSIKPGQIGGLHYGLQGMVDGKPRLVAENYERLRPDIAPHWPQPPGHGGYRIIVKGVPDMQLDLAFGGADPLADALIGTGMRAAHSIPAVCAARPGVIESFNELPHVHGYMDACKTRSHA